STAVLSIRTLQTKGRGDFFYSLNDLPFTRSGARKAVQSVRLHEKAAATSRPLPGRISNARRIGPAVGVPWPVSQPLKLSGGSSSRFAVTWSMVLRRKRRRRRTAKARLPPPSHNQMPPASRIAKRGELLEWVQ